MTESSLLSAFNELDWPMLEQRPAAPERARTDAKQRALYEALQESDRRLQARNKQLALVLDSARIGVWEYDLATMCATRSLPHDQIFGYTDRVAEWNVDTLLRHVASEDRNLARDRFQECLTTGETEFECRIVRADSAAAWIWVRGRVVHGPNGAPERMVGIVMDITHRKHPEQLLQDAVRRHDDFVATLAHEIRQPLSPILAALEVMRLAVSQASGERAQQVIKRQVGQISRLVDDLVEATRWARGKVPIHKSRVALSDVVDDAVNDIKPILEQQGHEFIVSTGPDAVWIEADGSRLQQVLSNLLRNAVKYTDPGGRIWLTVEAGGSTVTVRVRDTGQGIAPEALEYIFDLFAQVPGQANGGLGIGLSVVKEIVKLHDGTIKVRSAGLGQGSEFIITLPVLQATVEV